MLDIARILISSRLKAYPSVFWPIARLRENNKRRLVRRDTDLVIEGFWRCGNHFAVYAFISSQSTPPRVAHHFHAPAQLILASRWGAPRLLLIREPRDAIASATVFLEKDDPRPFIHFFNNFHRAVLPLADDLVISDFPTTVNDFGSVIQAVNAKFNRNYRLFGDTAEERAEVQRCIYDEHSENMGSVASTLPLPSAEKAARKTRALQALDEPACQSLMEEANQLYTSLKQQSI